MLTFDGIRREGLVRPPKLFWVGEEKDGRGMVMAGGGGTVGILSLPSLPSLQPARHPREKEGGSLRQRLACLGRLAAWLVALSTSTDEGEREDFLLLKGK